MNPRPNPLPAGRREEPLPWESDTGLHSLFLPTGAQTPLPPPEEGEPEMLPGHGVLDPFDDLLRWGPQVDIHARQPWGIGPIIAPNDCCYFVGLPNTGKTTLAADIIWGILAPERFDDKDGHGRCLGGAWKINREHFPHGERVLFIGAETTTAEAWFTKLAKRSIAAGLDLESEEHQSIINRCAFLDAEDKAFENHEDLRAEVRALAKEIIKRKFKVVVIDPVYNFFDPNENGDATWVTRGLKPFIRLLKQAGILVICLAHPSQAALIPKNALPLRLAPFGTTQQNGAIDCSFGILAGRKKSVEIELILTKSRTRDTQAWIPRYDSSIQLTFGQNGAGYSSYKLSKASRWEIENPKGSILLGTAERQLLAQLPVEPRFTTKAIQESGVTRHYMKTYLPQLVEKGVFTTTVIEGERGNPLEYRYTEEGIAQARRAREDFPDEARAGQEARGESVPEED